MCSYQAHLNHNSLTLIQILYFSNKKDSKIPHNVFLIPKFNWLQRVKFHYYQMAKP